MARRAIISSQPPASCDEIGASEQPCQNGQNGPGVEASETAEDPSEGRLWLREPVPSWDLGPPGFEATLEVFKNTPDELTIYLGPWEFVESAPARIVWQCAYRNELLEHFIPTADPSSALPFTLHGKHTEFSTQPLEGEQTVTFRGPQRLRYTSSDGVIVFDQHITPVYCFEAIDSSMRFQGDLRHKKLLDCFDADIVWTDVHRRENVFGGVMGIAVVQRIKLWRDVLADLHTLSVFASRWDRRHKEFDTRWFAHELQQDSKRRLVKLSIRGCVGEPAPDAPSFFPSRIPPRIRSFGAKTFIEPGDALNAATAQSRPGSQPGSRPSSRASSCPSGFSSGYASSFVSSHSSYSNDSSSSSSSNSRSSSLPSPNIGLENASADVPFDIQYLSIQFSQQKDFERFVETWAKMHKSEFDACVPPKTRNGNGLAQPSPAVLAAHGVTDDGVTASALPRHCMWQSRLG